MCIYIYIQTNVEYVYTYFLNQDLSLQKLCQTSLAEFPVLGTHPAQQVGLIHRDFLGDLHVCDDEFPTISDG